MSLAFALIPRSPDSLGFPRNLDAEELNPEVLKNAGMSMPKRLDCLEQSKRRILSLVFKILFLKIAHIIFHNECYQRRRSCLIRAPRGKA